MVLATNGKNRSGLSTISHPERMNVTLGILIVLSIGLIPINIFPRGGFQVADLFIVILITYFLLKRSNLVNNVNKYIYSLLPFVVWTNIVIGIYIITTNAFLLVLVALNMLYAFFMYYTFSNVWKELLSKKAYLYIYAALIISIICVFTFKGFKEWDDVRYSFSFNNPNQLGLFALIFLAITIVLMQQKIADNIRNIFYFSLDILFILLAHYWALMAISRATMVAITFLDLCLIKKIVVEKFFFPIALTISVGVVSMLLINPFFIQERFEVRGSNRFGGSAIEERFSQSIAGPLQDLQGFKVLIGTGYSTLAEVTGQTGISAGGRTKKIEVHNMFGNVLWSFGIVGLCLYVYWISNFIWGVRLIPNAKWIWASLLTFSLSGVLIRSRSYWLLIGLMLALLSIQMAKENSEKPNNLTKHGRIP